MTQENEKILTQWLVLNCQMGDPLAFEQLIKLWYPKLLRYAGNQLNDPNAAEDAVQASLETLSKSIRRLNDPASFPLWIYRVLNNKCVDLIRSKQKQEKIANAYAQLQPVQALQCGDGPQQEEFAALLSGLAPKLYKLVHLHYLEGLSMSEIGDILNLPAGTVKSRLHQARQLLSQRLKKEV